MEISKKSQGHYHNFVWNYDRNIPYKWMHGVLSVIDIPHNDPFVDGIICFVECCSVLVFLNIKYSFVISKRKGNGRFQRRKKTALKRTRKQVELFTSTAN